LRIIVDGIVNDSKNEEENEFVEKKTLHRGQNEASGIRAAIQEHRVVVGLFNPAEMVSDME